MKYSKQPETERFLLRVLTKNDASVEYLAWFKDPEALKYIASTAKEWSIERLRNYIENIESDPNAIFFGIFTRDTGRHIGNIKFENMDFSLGVATLGVLIGEPTWRGKGVFGETFLALQLLLARDFSVHKIYLGVDRENEAAVKSYIRSGFVTSFDGYLTAKNAFFSGLEMVSRFNP